MAESYLSSIWYRVADLQPRLRSHVKVHRHRYRGRPWYVLHDHASGRVHRFSPGAYMLIGQMDGGRTVDEVWRSLAEAYDEEAPGQDEVIRLLSRLHQNDLIQYAGSPDVADLLERYNRNTRQILKQNMLNPMSFRLPLIDPDAFLRKTLPAVRPLTGWFGLLLWLVVVSWGLITAAMNWAPLTRDIADQMLAASNLMIAAITYPLLKAVHELAHGYLTRARGGEVREMGVMFLVFFPVPYVDASAAAAFRNKWHRAAVSAGGIFVETFAAAVALIVWASAEPGMVRAVAYNVVLVGGLSTLLVNGNPLLKFDGYYVLSDIVEIPNLGNRANKYWGHIVQRHVFGAKQLREEVATPGEKAWFVLYAPAAFVYRIVIMVGIALYVAQKFFLLGVLLAIWSVFNAVVKPLFKNIRHVMTAPALRKVRRRANAWTFGSIGVALGLALLIPLPLRTDTQGVVWLPDEAHLRARTQGFVTDLIAAEGARVGPQDRVAEMEEPTVRARIAVLEWRVEEMRRRLTATEVQDRRSAEVARLELREAEAELARERDRIAELTIRAAIPGTFQPALPGRELVSRYVSEGDLIAYVLPDGPRQVRALVPQKDIALVRNRLQGVELKIAGHLDRPVPAKLLRDVPQATPQAPAAVLTTAGGGPFLIDPTDSEGATLLEQAFIFDLLLPESAQDAPYGTRVYVRFDHGSEPAALQIWRRVRQLFLKQFNA
ncbi:PqqD family peptide modification chaperone [Salipiger abyssi]|uniref:PqqD family peptide modification chaperone n=1 Tax=Salipiger abyssi TaxID=1250539 RepID=UPI001A8FDA15|nr:PqqD family peptide modification chaperone [Salipiger abyssi]MBN9888927.1 PqqD family peptide modification chaperone [Salipiger abyssi]